MCVAIPGKVVSIGEAAPGATWGNVEFGDRTLKINLVMLPDVGIGDHVIVHSGYAIRTVVPFGQSAYGQGDPQSR